MNRKELAVKLGISASMVTRLARRGMPTDSVDRAQRWRKRHLEPGRMKGARVDTLAATGDVPVAPGAPTEEGELRPAIQLEISDRPDGASAPAIASSGDGGEQPVPDAGYQLSRARQAAADARTAELKLAELEGSLVRVDHVRAELAARLAPVREALLQIPARLAPLLAPQSDPGRIQTVLEIEIHQVLAPLSKASGLHATEGTGAA
jgi:phage terminase Nu1 subunit (DNA packaging protein)